MRTLKVKKGAKFEDKFPPGWHTLTVLKAKYGTFQDSKFIDVWFKEYADMPKLSLRIWAKTGENGEEFAIGRLFRFANAGIKKVSKSDDGDAIITIDDNPAELVGNKINVYFYKKGEKKYTEVLSNIAPTEFSNELESFNASDIEYWKEKAEDYYKNYVLSKKESDDVKVVDKVEDIPW